MIAFPDLPQDLDYIAEWFIAPLVMLWFALHWLFLGLNKEHPEGERKAARSGSSAGIVLAVVILVVCFRFLPKCDESQISPRAALWALAVGALFGLLTRFLHARKETILRLVEEPEGKSGEDAKNAWKAKRKVARRPARWSLPVASGTALGLASLVLYYAGPPYAASHLWLMWVFLALLCSYRLALPFGDRP